MRLALFVPRDGKRWVAWTSEGFYDASADGDSLIGYHLNQGPQQAGEFIATAQLRQQFYRPDLVTSALDSNIQSIFKRAFARAGIADVSEVLRGGLPPAIELLSPSESSSTGEFRFDIRVTDRGGGIGRVVYYIDDQEVAGRPVDIPTPGGFSRWFSLADGQRAVRAAVYNARDELESRSAPAIVNVRTKEEPSTLYVIAAGVTNYRDRKLASGVKFGAADARAVAARFEQQASGVFARVEAIPLVDAEATLDNIKKTIAGVATRMKAGDTFIFYLAGHGTAYEGDYSFIPWEVQSGTADAMYKQSLNHTALQELLRQIPAQKTLLLLDTCNSGAFDLGPANRGQAAAISRFAKITGRAILAAAGSAQMALEGSNNHGVFTDVLLRAFSNDPNQNGRIEVNEVIEFVQLEVPRITQARWGYRQLPVQEFRGQNFAIARR
jgi:hypothetical protein